ncbi:MAG: DUF2267 domain-containing protein [Archangiaceae bacterium]|nr:DUF2267 domain-containing protein [Archangiaceae bacterium]
MESFSSASFLRRVAERAGLSAAVGGDLTEATLRGLGEQLPAEHSAALAGELPPTLGVWLSATDPGSARGLGALLERLAQGDGRGLSFCAQHAAVVLQVLAEVLRPAAVRALAQALPDDIAALLRPSD